MQEIAQRELQRHRERDHCERLRFALRGDDPRPTDVEPLNEADYRETGVAVFLAAFAGNGRDAIVVNSTIRSLIWHGRDRGIGPLYRWLVDGPANSALPELGISSHPARFSSVTVSCRAYAGHSYVGVRPWLGGLCSAVRRRIICAEGAVCRARLMIFVCSEPVLPHRITIAGSRTLLSSVG